MLNFFISLVFFASANEFKKINISINKLPLSVEVADSESKQQQGLMFRKELKEGEGMLFIFKDQQIRSFWMKNTFIDLSIGYFDKRKILINYLDMKATKPEGETYYPTYSSEKPAMYALEVPKGWFSKHKIKPGDKLVLK